MVGVSVLTDMPDEILRNIFANFTLRERLSSCSLVCRRFHTAAAAATQQLKLSRCNEEQFASFQRYLVSNGQHLRSLKVDRFNEHFWQLPCSNLKELDIEFCTVQLDPVQLAGYSYPGILQSCSGLTKLKLGHCKLLLSFDSSTLAAVPELRHLQLTWPSSICAAVDRDIVLPERLLLHLTKLTHLQLDTIEGEGMQGCLQHLSSLEDLAVLNLNATMTKVVWGPSTTPGLSRLTALTHLCLHKCDMDREILGGFTELRWLKLEQINMCSEHAAGVSEGMLLSCIARMPHLQHLALKCWEFEWPDDAAAYSALTASSNLQQLHLGENELPAGVWRAMFPVGKMWPHLQVLSAPRWDYFLPDEELAMDPDVTELSPDLPTSAYSKADLRLLVSCCPALQDITLTIQEDVLLSSLTALPALRELCVHGVNDVSMVSLAALTQLTKLWAKVTDGVHIMSLLGLTALRDLRRLHIDLEAVETPAHWKPVMPDYSCGESEPANVWLQLLLECASNRHCRPLVMKSLAEHMAAQQQQLAVQQQCCVQLQQQLTQPQPPHHHQQELEQQVVLLQQQVCEQQQQLSAAAAHADQLQARMQALEGQVQQLMQVVQQHMG